MEDFLSPGRHVWVVNVFDGITGVVSCTVTKFKRFLPAGPVAVAEPSSTDGIRVHSLVQFYSDPGGLRTVTAADIRLSKPSGVRESRRSSDEDDD